MDRTSIRLVTDRETINKVIFDTWVFDRTSDDHSQHITHNNFPYHKFLFLGGFVKAKIAALYYQNAYRDGYMAHFQVLAPYRLEYARYFAKGFLDFIQPCSKKIYGEIPVLYKDYIHFVKKLGFREIETIEKNHLKKGVLYDSVLLVYEG